MVGRGMTVRGLTGMYVYQPACTVRVQDRPAVGEGRRHAGQPGHVVNATVMKTAGKAGTPTPVTGVDDLRKPGDGDDSSGWQYVYR